MERVEAYHILGKMSTEEWVSAEQAEALYIAQKDVEYVDLMPNDMTLVVRCKDCKHHRFHEGYSNYYYCEYHSSPYLHDHFRTNENDYCSRAERKDD